MGQDIFHRILAVAKANPEKIDVFKDALQQVKHTIKRDRRMGMLYSAELKKVASETIKSGVNVALMVHFIFDILVVETPYSLDSYFQALEFDRPAKEKFYLPRRKQLLPLVRDLEDLLINDKLDELFTSQPPRTGKLLADSTPILTTKGWKKHGDLQVGDYVFSPYGGIPVKVLAVLPKNHTTHTITFSDHTQIKCHFRHEWKVYDRNTQKWELLETQELIKRGLDNGKGKIRGHRYRFLVCDKDPIEGIKVDLPVKPYTFGAWLGDGNNGVPRLSNDKKDLAIIDSVVKEGYSVRHTYIHKTTGVVMNVFNDLREDLHKIGLCYTHKTVEKYIPDCYLYAPIKDRLELLAGLLDTDGSLIKRENRYHFSTTSEKLKDSIISLISTFGWRVSINEVEPKTSTSGVIGRKIIYTIGFNPTMEIPCRLERKQLKDFSKQRKISIIDIKEQTEEEQEQGNCITVYGGMYLAGERMIPTHNTSLALFTISWLIGTNPELANLYSSCSTGLCGSFYKGLFDILNDDMTYNWWKIFPNARFDKNSMTNAKETYLDTGKIKRYHSFTARSIDAENLNGSCDCNGLLIGDDLCSGIEEALNPQRLVALWLKVNNNLLSRKKMNAKCWWIGTRWSKKDPIGVRLSVLENGGKDIENIRFKVHNIPALNENDESNFDYAYRVGFDTEYYKQLRSGFELTDDTASWLAQYMGQPIERSGQLFDPSTLNYFEDLPMEDDGKTPKKPDRIFAFCDVALGGGDNLSFPVAYQFGSKFYVVDWIFDNGDKDITRPRVVSCILRHKIQASRFEANNGGEQYEEWIKDNLEKEHGYRHNITAKYADSLKAKQVRIFDKAPDIKRDFFFLSPRLRNHDYRKAMDNMFAYQIMQNDKHKHEDAPDSMAGLAEMAYETISSPTSFEVFRRPF